ncbi:nitroreductase [Ramlibacter sp. RBP-2]|uniref:Nitroreductase n=1 Tax=Ramlibacter lithotrophicus TaxID=2606681 RepID=A0A7X6DKJ7_9BURK|nr:nitroreductase [Ramlibacter lithotrophicus]NKE68872.1 nitroreductase [Ramlibacter lithotrophicus]
MRERFSCRAFLTKSVPRSDIQAILRLAQRTATWCNTQPWHVYITEAEGTNRLRQSLYAQAQSASSSQPDIPWPREYRGVYLQRRREAGFTLYRALGIARDDTAGRSRQLLENYRFFGAPHMLVVTTDEALGPYAYLDCGGYVANFLSAAHAHGVSTCAQAAIAHHAPLVRNHFGIPPERTIVCGISFGYADREHPANSFRLPRADIADAVEWVTH